mmetsp:Transcript_24706/g.38463  ORF Transcript_24706/g.38463 Transcript_24706/m.38463 type:complete len:82 (+) Transcript_24706:23-268(+)
MEGPIVIGSSVFACKYKDGIIFASDTHVTIGGTSKAKKFSRMAPLADEGIFACSGEMSDYQKLKKEFEEEYERDLIENDGA